MERPAPNVGLRVILNAVFHQDEAKVHKYAAVFEAQEIGVHEFMQLDESTLSQLGIAKVGARLAILNHVAQQRWPVAEETAPSTGVPIGTTTKRRGSGPSATTEPRPSSASWTVMAVLLLVGVIVGYGVSAIPNISRAETATIFKPVAPPGKAGHLAKSHFVDAGAGDIAVEAALIDVGAAIADKEGEEENGATNIAKEDKDDAARDGLAIPWEGVPMSEEIKQKRKEFRRKKKAVIKQEGRAINAKMKHWKAPPKEEYEAALAVLSKKWPKRPLKQPLCNTPRSRRNMHSKAMCAKILGPLGLQPWSIPLTPAMAVSEEMCREEVDALRGGRGPPPVKIIILQKHLLPIGRAAMHS